MCNADVEDVDKLDGHDMTKHPATGDAGSAQEGSDDSGANPAS